MKIRFRFLEGRNNEGKVTVWGIAFTGYGHVMMILTGNRSLISSPPYAGS